MKLTKISELSGLDHTIDLPITQQEYINGMSKLNQGMNIQDAFPQLNPDEREFILNGITKQEWDDENEKEEKYDNNVFTQDEIDRICQPNPNEPD